MLDTHHIDDIMIQRFHPVSQKVHRTSIRVQPFRCIWYHHTPLLHSVSKKRSTKPQYGYSHLDFYSIMIHRTCTVSPNKVLRTSIWIPWIQPFRCLQHNGAQLLQCLKKVHRTTILVQPCRCPVSGYIAAVHQSGLWVHYLRGIG